MPNKKCYSTYKNGSVQIVEKIIINTTTLGCEKEETSLIRAKKISLKKRTDIDTNENEKNEPTQTYILKRTRLCSGGKVTVTGLQQPRQSKIFHGTASASGGIGILSTSLQPSKPEPSLRH